jgi:hypothetical protein
VNSLVSPFYSDERKYDASGRVSQARTIALAEASALYCQVWLS